MFLPDPLVSFVISTFNRRDVLLTTLDHITRCGLSPDQYEIIVIDNASPDGTANAIRQRFSHVKLLALSVNRGSCAKNLGIKFARAKYVVFLDDDSYPRPGSLARMIRHFEADPKLGAAGFTVHLTDGSQECSAYPDVFIGCGVGFRRRALEQAGGLPENFFMQAEEYDLSLRLLDAGWKIRTFDDLHVTHLKSPTARSLSRTTRLDVRNNLTLIFRYFPKQWRRAFAVDWMHRYWMIANGKGHRTAYFLGFAAGLTRAFLGRRQTISDSAFEQFARIAQLRAAMQAATQEHSLKRILFVDLGKNVLPYYLAAQASGLQIIAIADQRLGNTGRRYRDIPIVTDDSARALSFDAVIISNSSPVHAAARCRQWRELQSRPVLNLLDAHKETAAALPEPAVAV